MAGDKELLVLFGIDGVDTGPRGGGKDLQVLFRFNVPAVHGGMARVRHIEDIVKAAEENTALVFHAVRIHPEELFWQGLLRDAEVMV